MFEFLAQFDVLGLTAMLGALLLLGGLLWFLLDDRPLGEASGWRQEPTGAPCFAEDANDRPSGPAGRSHAAGPGNEEQESRSAGRAA